MVTPTLSSEFGPVAADFQISPWWTASLPFKHDGGLVQKLKMAEANGVSEREWGRLTSAVKEDWNSLAFLLEIESAEPVYGWFGGFKGIGRKGAGASQSGSAVETSGKGNLSGGGTQSYIPNLPYSAVATYSINPI
jgi:hypothetical protein